MKTRTVYKGEEDTRWKSAKEQAMARSTGKQRSKKDNPNQATFRRMDSNSVDNAASFMRCTPALQSARDG
jgi:hypothetical protein